MRALRWETVEDLARRRMIGAIAGRKDFWAGLEEVVRAAERLGVNRETAVDILVEIIETRMKGHRAGGWPGA
ncbi:MAG TPA: hypothetical protein VIK99_05745 [Thermaerobacter sp.]